MLTLSYGTAFADTAEGPALQEVNRILFLFDDFSSVIRVLIAIVATLVFLYFFWGLADYIRQDKAAAEDAKKRMGWGIIGIFVLVSIWGLVYFLQTAVLGSGGSAQPGPDIEFRKVESIAPVQ